MSEFPHSFLQIFEKTICNLSLLYFGLETSSDVDIKPILTSLKIGVHPSLQSLSLSFKKLSLFIFNLISS